MIGSVNSALHESSQRLVARRYLVNPLQPFHLLDYLVGDLQVVLSNVLLHRLNADLEFALILG